MDGKVCLFWESTIMRQIGTCDATWHAKQRASFATHR